MQTCSRMPLSRKPRGVVVPSPAGVVSTFLSPVLGVASFAQLSGNYVIHVPVENYPVRRLLPTTAITYVVVVQIGVDSTGAHLSYISSNLPLSSSMRLDSACSNNLQLVVSSSPAPPTSRPCRAPQRGGGSCPCPLCSCGVPQIFGRTTTGCRSHREGRWYRWETGTLQHQTWHTNGHAHRSTLRVTRRKSRHLRCTK